MKVGRASGEPVLAEAGPPFMLSLDVAGYCSVRRTLRNGAVQSRSVPILKCVATGAPWVGPGE